jgi:hypothetical protein
MGFRLSIDDFGTGEASLAYLADLPSDELKLDRRFVSRIVSSERDRAIVSSTIALAHALGQAVVAEGIEDAATFSLLHDLGCGSGQGYYLGRPQPFASFRTIYEESLLRHRSLRFKHLLTMNAHGKRASSNRDGACHVQHPELPVQAEGLILSNQQSPSRSVLGFCCFEV